MKQMTLQQITKACNGEFIGDNDRINATIDGIAIDNRMIQQGYLFIPIIGEVHDGHKFIQSSFENGAICCLTEQEINDDNNYIKVESTFQALKDIAEYYRSLFDVIIIGVTGSVGKTTTKEMIASVLSQKYNVHKSEKNFNNEIGVPLTLFGLKEEHDFAIIEMGMNHFHEISRLSKTTRPDICVIVNIDYTHVGHLGSREGVFKAKTEIFDYAKEDCIAYLNGDDDMLYSLKDNELNTIFFGFEKHNDIVVQNIVPLGLEGTECTILFDSKLIEIHINKPGKHLLYAVMVASAIGNKFELNDDEIRKGIADFQPVDKRMDTITTSTMTILNDVYNASPVSVRAAIDVLCYAEGRKVCILGDMLELGSYGPSLHYDIGCYSAEKEIDIILCAGQLSKNIIEGAKEQGANALWFETQEEMIKHLDKYIQHEDTVLVKASRGMHFEKTVEELREL